MGLNPSGFVISPDGIIFVFVLSMFLKKSVHISFALLLLVSTLGVTVNLHYCHGNLKTVKIFKVDKPCCTNPNCCQTETISVKLDNDYVAQQEFELKKIEVSKVFATLALLTPQQADQNTYLNSHLFKKDSPPLVVDIPVLIQSFLI